MCNFKVKNARTAIASKIFFIQSMQGNISDVIYVLHYYHGVPSFLMAEDVGGGEKEAEEEAECSWFTC